MKLANAYKQNTRDWYRWRDSGLGASDAPAVLGTSPWTSAFELWAEKTGLLKRPEPNAFAVAAMRRGQDMEPDARAWYAKARGVLVEPLNCEHAEHEFLRASLDGYVAAEDRIVEIKCPGKEGLKEAQSLRVPKTYLPQVYMQLAVSGARSLDFVTYAGKGTGYFDGQDGIVVTVQPDLAYQADLIAKMTAFWQLVKTKTPPQVDESDMERINKLLGPARARVESLEAAAHLLSSLMVRGSIGQVGGR